MIDIKLPFWLDGEQLGKLTAGSKVWWTRAEGWIYWTRTQFDPLTCAVPLLNLLAYQRDVQRFNGESEELFRKRVKFAYLNARDAGQKAGFERIFERLGLGHLDQVERFDETNWDVIKLLLTDTQISENPDLLMDIVMKYGRTCRRYTFTTEDPITFGLPAFDVIHTYGYQVASLVAGAVPETDNQAPSVPSMMTANVISSTRIDLVSTAATDNVGVIGYKWYRGEVLSDQVGFVGASVSMNAVNGAITLGSNRFGSALPTYGGGGVYQWAKNLTDSNPYWAAFKAEYTARPFKIVWLQLAALATDAANETYANALAVVNQIKTRVPGAVVYVSAQPNYTPSTWVCSLAGADGPARMQSLADQLVANGECERGPVMGPLVASTMLRPNDTCHANTTGENFEGQQLINFFNGVTPSITYAQVGTTTSPNFSDTGVTGGKTYSYKVAAYDAANNTSALSAPMTAQAALTQSRAIGFCSIDTVINETWIKYNLLRIGWKALNPSSGVYDFSAIESRIDKLPAHQQLSLVVFAVGASVGNAQNTKTCPDFVISGASATWSAGDYGTSPVPGDAFAQSAWDTFCNALANHVYQGYALKDHPKIANVDCSIPGCQGIRLRSLPPNYTAAGYKQACIDGVTSMITRFPSKNCYVGLFGIINKTADARDIRDTLIDLFPNIAFFQENWTGKNPDFTSDQGKLVQEVASTNAIMVQSCGTFSNQAAFNWCGWAVNDNPQLALDHVAGIGVTYFELYEADIKYASYKQTWIDHAATFPTS